MDENSPIQNPTALPQVPIEQPPTPKKHRRNLIMVTIVGAILLCVIIAALIATSISGNKEKPNTQAEQPQTSSDKSRQALPADFPSDVPIYEGVVTSSQKTTVDGKPAWKITITTGTPVADVAPVLSYHFTSEGWTTSLNNATAEGGTIVAKKGNLDATITYAAAEGQTSMNYEIMSALSGSR